MFANFKNDPVAQFVDACRKGPDRSLPTIN